MQELVDAGKIKARTKWKQVYPLFSKDERYLAMLGNPGSNQLELFWDIVDDFDQKLDEKIRLIEEALKARDESFVVKVDTSEESFLELVSSLDNPELAAIPKEALADVYSTVCVVLVCSTCTNCFSDA